MVLAMLASLFLLILAVLGLVYTKSDPGGVIEFGKWTVSVLVGAFGAWIGAGAAYFFGKENLAESSRSTVAALEIQQQTLQGTNKRDLMKDLTLATMNSSFNFTSDTTKENVIRELKDYPDYWWIPIFDKEKKGALEDILHVRIIWDDQFESKETVGGILQKLNEQERLKPDETEEDTSNYDKLHGQAFFITVRLDDKIADTVRRMEKSGAVIGIVTDEKGKPTYCFTKHNLMTT
jgi:hypothetical protein